MKKFIIFLCIISIILFMSGCNQNKDRDSDDAADLNHADDAAGDVDDDDADNGADDCADADNAGHGTFSYTVPKCDSFAKVPVITTEWLPTFLELHFGFVDSVNYDLLKPATDEESLDDKDYTSFYQNSEGIHVGWYYTIVDNKIISSAYNFPPDYIDVFAVGFKAAVPNDDGIPVADITYIDFYADGDYVIISFGEEYVDSVYVISDVEEQALFYSNGNIESLEMLEDGSTVYDIGYYESGNLKHEFYYDENSLLDGTIYYYYDNKNNQLKSETEYEAGMRNGEHYSYYEDGSPKEIYFYIYDERDGLQTWYDTSGVEYSAVYVDGKKQ